MANTTTSRAEMIGKLVEHSIAMATAESPQYWLKEVFDKGFIGYSKLSTPQLRMEMQLHGLDKSAEMSEANDALADDENEYLPSRMLS